jgi:cell fate regulator YaaT (PSP1 superfamily)
MIMENINLPVVIGVRFSKVGKTYHFDASLVPDVQIGDTVVVETSRGWQLGWVSQLLATPDAVPEGLKTIDRRATPRDLLLRQTWQAREADVITGAKTRASELNLRGVKIVAAEFSFDGTRLSILFSSESEDKVELKSLRQDMQRNFNPAQVELRQIGPRDVAKLLCWMGACGLEQRCCSQFLCEFSSISIRMAKEQGISLTPSEITGMCGRLRCCLIYEYDQYVEARQRLPKRNKRVMTQFGEGRVIDIAPLRDAAVIEYPDGMRREIPREQLLVLEEGVPAPATMPMMPGVVVEEPETEIQPREEPKAVQPRREQRQTAPRPHPNASRPVKTPPSSEDKQQDQTPLNRRPSRSRRQGNRRPRKP